MQIGLGGGHEIQGLLAGQAGHTGHDAVATLTMARGAGGRQLLALLIRRQLQVVAVGDRGRWQAGVPGGQIQLLLIVQACREILQSGMRTNASLVISQRFLEISHRLPGQVRDARRHAMPIRAVTAAAFRLRNQLASLCISCRLGWLQRLRLLRTGGQQGDGSGNNEQLVHGNPRVSCNPVTNGGRPKPPNAAAPPESC